MGECRGRRISQDERREVFEVSGLWFLLGVKLKVIKGSTWEPPGGSVCKAAAFISGPSHPWVLQWSLTWGSLLSR